MSKEIVYREYKKSMAQFVEASQEALSSPQSARPVVRFLMHAYPVIRDDASHNLLSTVQELRRDTARMAVKLEITDNNSRDRADGSISVGGSEFAITSNRDGGSTVAMLLSLLKSTESVAEEVESLLDTLTRPVHQTLKNFAAVPVASENRWAATDMMAAMTSSFASNRESDAFHAAKPRMTKAVAGIFHADALPANLLSYYIQIESILERWYDVVTARHGPTGMPVFGSVMATDVILEMVSRIDPSKEIQNGVKMENLSMAATRSAVKYATAITSAREAITNPDFFSQCLVMLASLAELADSMREAVVGPTGAAKPLYDAISFGGLTGTISLRKIVEGINFERFHVRSIQHDPAESGAAVSKQERFFKKHFNEMIASLVEKYTSGISADGLVQEAVDRLYQINKFFLEENSFYTCTLGAGSPFGGEAPGALKVIPGERPSIRMEDVVGSGFDEVRKFFASIEDSAKFRNLFLATSPSKSADKANVLLIGPPGCGKTEILRAVGSDQNSIGVFAQGSDFLTAWSGEAQKNPKRLFEAGVRLARQADRRVHFLIDEIDSVLNNDRNTSTTNLSLEFQVLMDGVVSYPNLSIWGATNFPERIPSAMLRRFNKVLIVGELNEKQMTHLLQHFIGFMPMDISDAAWSAAATKLEGAVGDVVRKVADTLWREKLDGFVKDHAEDAQAVSDWLATLVTDPTETFSVDHLNREKRRELHSRLRKMTVTDADLSRVVDETLTNVAVVTEIEDAKAAYTRAKEFMAGLSQ